MYSHTPIHLYLSNFCQFVLEIYLEHVPSLNAGGGGEILPTSSSSSTSLDSQTFLTYFFMWSIYMQDNFARMTTESRSCKVLNKESRMFEYQNIFFIKFSRF